MPWGWTCCVSSYPSASGAHGVLKRVKPRGPSRKMIRTLWILTSWKVSDDDTICQALRPGGAPGFECAYCGAPYFRLTVGEAEAIWAELVQAVSRWRSVAKGLGMQSTDLVDFEPAFA